MFPEPHLKTRQSWENSGQSCEPEKHSGVCITVENSPNSPEYLDEVIETRTKVLYCIYNFFSKTIRQMKERNEAKLLIETDFFDTRSYFLPANQTKKIPIYVFVIVFVSLHLDI